jgi:hypothetical protein
VYTLKNNPFATVQRKKEKGKGDGVADKENNILCVCVIQICPIVFYPFT